MSVFNLLGSPARELLFCHPQDALLDVVEELVAENLNAIAVLDKQENLVGILTDHDVMRALSDRCGNLEGARVRDWMSEKVIACRFDASLTEALRLMGKHGVRHLVIMDCGVPIAVLGIREVLAKIHERDELEISVLRDIAIAARASLAA